MAPTFCIELTGTHQSRLLSIARRSIDCGLRTRQPLLLDSEKFAGPLAEKLASFVTLRQDGELRGCVGSLEADSPLAKGVALMAYGAAFRDTRFPPLELNELEFTQIEISVLSIPDPIECRSESELLASLRPNEDGLLLEDRGRSASFLPVMWQRSEDPREFVRLLKHKAGWPADYWSGTIRAYRYEALSFEEETVSA